MNRVLAALDTSPAARPVLETAAAVARLFHAEVEAIHVREDRPTAAIEELAHRHGTPLHVLPGEPAGVLRQQLAAPEVLLAVLGGGSMGDSHPPVGHIALPLVTQAAKPVIVVPPASIACIDRRVDRVLIPLDGSVEASTAVEALLALLADAGAETIALHVFDTGHPPAFLDQSYHGLTAWRHEFAVRHAAAARVELRVGVTATQVIDVAAEEGVNLIAMGWSQQLDPDRAAVVRGVLCEAATPVLLIPVDDRVPTAAAPGAGPRSQAGSASPMPRAGPDPPDGPRSSGGPTTRPGRRPPGGWAAIR
jgi:nucleotide-binding universal stress UspA family protein